MIPRRHVTEAMKELVAQIARMTPYTYESLYASEDAIHTINGLIEKARAIQSHIPAPRGLRRRFR